MNHYSKKQLNIILMIVLLGFIGNSIAYPIFAPLFLNPSVNTIVPEYWGASLRGLWLGVTLMMYPLGQFFGSPILGALSDQYGRKTIIVVSSSVMILFYFGTAIALAFHQLWLLVLSRLLTGCAEGNIAIARSMVSDIKSLDKHKSFGLISAMSALGYIIGPLIGGLLSDKAIATWFSYALPFYLATVFSLVVTLFAGIYLEESLSSKQKSSVTILKQFDIISRLNILFRNKELKFILITSLIAALSYDVFYEFFPAYMTGMWHATSSQIASYNVILSFTIGCGCGWLSPHLSTRITRETAVIYALPVIALMLFAFVFYPNPQVVPLLFVIIGLAIAISTTNFTIQVSEAAGSAIQGEVMGTMWGLRMLLDGFASIFCGLLLSFSYSLPLALAGFSALLAWILFYKKITTSRQSPEVVQHFNA